MIKAKSLLDPAREDKSSYQFSIDTCELIKEVIKKNKKINSVEDLKKELRSQAKKIMKVHPLEFTIENVIRRFISIIQDHEIENKKSEASKFSNMALKIQKNKEDQDIMGKNISKEDSQDNESGDNLNLQKQQSQTKSNFELQKAIYIQEADELMQELTQDISDAINKYAPSHISSNEVILTYEYSKTVENFLIRAKRERQFEVIVLLGDTDCRGEEMGKNLAKAGITVTVIPFSAAYAFMPRVNKIYIGVHAIMKNGGILAEAGSLMLATAAKAYRVDFIVLGSSIKLTPHFPFEQNTYNELLNPNDLLPDQSNIESNVSILAAKYDYLAPQYITLYITNFGEHSPSYIYRLFNEFY